MAAASRENIDISNRDIANYLANCQQYDLLIDTMQNGILDTLMDDQQEKLAEGDIHKGIQTKVYLNNQLIGQSSKNNNRLINWQK